MKAQLRKGYSDDYYYALSVKGYGDYTSKDGEGSIAILEIFEGELRLIVWADINQEDPTHIINLEQSKETYRIEA